MDTHDHEYKIYAYSLRTYAYTHVYSSFYAQILYIENLVRRYGKMKTKHSIMVKKSSRMRKIKLEDDFLKIFVLYYYNKIYAHREIYIYCSSKRYRDKA